jgi:electron transfer flavoprotein alpha subunit
MSAILTFAEHKDGKVRRSSLETLSEAVRLAARQGGDVASVIIGPEERVMATSEPASTGTPGAGFCAKTLPAETLG